MEHSTKKLFGFTLVELIVVIAIIGVLAAMLVPSLIGYVNSSRYRTANANAKQVYTSASTYCAEYLENNRNKTAPANTDVEIIDTWDAGNVARSITDSVDKYMGADAKGSYYVIVVQDMNVIRAYWSRTKTANSDICGSYPRVIDYDAPQTLSIDGCVDVINFANEPEEGA